MLELLFPGSYQPLASFSDSFVIYYIPNASFIVDCLPHAFVNGGPLIYSIPSAYLLLISSYDDLKLLFEDQS